MAVAKLDKDWEQLTPSGASRLVLAFAGMGAITIRNVDEQLKHRLQLRAARNGRSMESEAREILRQAVDTPDAPNSLIDALRQRVGEIGGVDLQLPPRTEQPRAPRL
jgi:antitoxin FitA